MIDMIRNQVFIDISDMHAVLHTHSVATTAELVAGLPAFDKGALLCVVGIGTPVYVGNSQAQAESHAVATPANVPIFVRLPSRSQTLWIDADTAGTVSIYQIGQTGSRT